MAESKLTKSQLALLADLKPRLGYANVYSIGDARGYRELEALRLVRIGNPRGAPANARSVHPYFGVKLNAAGRAALQLQGGSEQ